MPGGAWTLTPSDSALGGTHQYVLDDGTAIPLDIFAMEEDDVMKMYAGEELDAVEVPVAVLQQLMAGEGTMDLLQNLVASKKEVDSLRRERAELLSKISLLEGDP